MGEAREAFAEAAQAFTGVVSGLRAAAWSRPGLGEWTVRDLVGHTARALTTVDTYLNHPAERVDVPDAAAYYAATRAAADPAMVAERGRQAGAALGADPAGRITDLAAAVVERVRAAPPDAVLHTLVGAMRLADYLPTRVLELTVHSLDILAAEGRELRFPAAPMRLTYRLVGELGAQHPDAAGALLALTGRRALARGFTVL